MIKNLVYRFLNKSLLSNFEVCLLAGFFTILWPLTTNGNFFNNWINLISFYPLGFYLYFIKKMYNFLNFKNFLDKEFLKFNIILISIISFIFLFSVKFEYFQFRFFVLILLFPCLIKIYKDIIEKNFTFFKFFSTISIFFILHIGINLYFESKYISQYSLFGVVFFY